MNSLKTSVRGAALAVAAFVLFNMPGFNMPSHAQVAAASPSDTAGAVRDLQDQVHQLRDLVEQMRADLRPIRQMPSTIGHGCVRVQVEPETSAPIVSPRISA